MGLMAYDLAKVHYPLFLQQRRPQGSQQMMAAACEGLLGAKAPASSRRLAVCNRIRGSDFWTVPETSCRRRRNDNINKICVLEGGWGGEILRKIVPKRCLFFPGKFHDNKIWKFYQFYCQKFCCHLGGSYLGWERKIHHMM